MTLNISFSANPPFGHAKVLQADKVNIIGNNGSADCCGVPVQHYSILVANVARGDRIIFQYEHKIKNFTHDFFCVHESNPGGGTAVNNSAITVIFPVLGGILILIIIVYALIKKRRNSADALLPVSTEVSPSENHHGAVEILNTLYNNTELGSSGNAQENLENVLYESASGATDVHEEGTKPLPDIYAEVVKPKKKKKASSNKKGDAEDAVKEVLYESASGATDVYAAVVKPKKKKKGSSKNNGDAEETVKDVSYESASGATDVYAAVMKPNKKKKDSSEKKDSTADTPSASGLQSDDTYAVVNKKQKSEKSGNKNEEVVESSQTDQTYAVVDKKKKKK